MTKLGAGLQPAGSTSAGYGTPNTEPTHAGIPLLDKFSNPTGSRLVDEKTSRYVFDENGRLLGENDVRHMVRTRIKTVRGSSAWPGGLRAYGGVIGQGFVARITDDIKLALEDITTAGLVELVSVKVDVVQPSRVLVHIEYRDLNTNQLSSLELA